MLPQLPSLKVLRLGIGEEAEATLPTLFQLAALRSSTLRHLDCTVINVCGETLALGALPALVSCVITWGMRGGHALHVTPDSLGGATALTRLVLADHCDQIHLAPRCFDCLSSLKVLSFRRCGLTAVPAALLGVRGTLLHLDLSDNSDALGDTLEVDQTGYDTLLALQALRVLDLTKYMSWRASSLEFLVRFQCDWMQLHPRSRPPVLKLGGR